MPRDLPGEEEADVARHAVRPVDDHRPQAVAGRVQARVPELVGLPRPAGQGGGRQGGRGPALPPIDPPKEWLSPNRPKELIEFSMMTWPEVYDAIHHQGKTVALYYAGGNEHRGPQNVNGGHTLMGRATVRAIAEELGDAIAREVLEETSLTVRVGALAEVFERLMPDAGEANHLVLVARIVALSALRYTPAGLPAIDFELEHESQQTDADTPRTVRLSIKAVALGEMTKRIMQLDSSATVHFEGFLVSPRIGQSVTFHVQDFKTP